MVDPFVLILLCLFIILMFFGLNISSILMLVAITGIIYTGGLNSLSNILQVDTFSTITSYTLTTIPLFILMSQFVINSGLIRDVYIIIYNYSRGKTGILGVLTIMLGGVLGAVSGSGTATSATLGQVSVKELESHGFKPELAGAIAASGGSLSSIIPPSIILILFGATTQTSVNKLFMGAIIPGIILMIVFIVTMLVFHWFDTKNSEQSKQQIFRKKNITAMRYFITVTLSLSIILIIFVGIYFGIFTPTEAGSVGASTALIAAIFLKKVNFKFIKVSVVETIKVTGMVMIIVLAAQIFARFVTQSLLPRQIIELISPLLSNTILTIIFLIVLYFLLFMFIEAVAVIVMTVPIILPILTTSEIDLLWFGVLVGIVATIGLLTPPVGLSVFAVSGATQIPIGSIFRITTIIAFIAMIVMAIAMIVFPEIVTWLPSKMD